MAQLICPRCGANVEFTDAQSACPNCGELVGAITAAPPIALPPLTAVTTPDVADAEQARKRAEYGDDERWPDRSIQRDGGRWGLRFPSLSLINVLVIVAIVAILIALLVPSVEKVRDAAARTQSMDNLKQIALAVHGFHDTNKRLPFNGSDASPAKFPEIEYSKQAVGGSVTTGSWAFQILPFVEQGPLFQRIDRQIVIPTYLCPARGRDRVEVDGGAWTDYFYNNYLNDPQNASKPDNPDARRTLKEITDGTSNTVLVGHGNINTSQYAANANVAGSTNIFLGGTLGTMRAGDNGKANPTGVTLQRDSDANPGVGSWGGPFPQGALIAMCDGTVRMIPYTTQNFGAILTPSGDDPAVLGF